MKKTDSTPKKLNLQHEIPVEASENPLQKKEKPGCNNNFSGISTKSMIKFWLIWGLFAFLGYLFMQSLDMIYIIFTAIIIAISMEGMILSFEKRLKTRWGAITIAYIFLLAFVLSGIIFVIPFLISQISLLVQRISTTLIELKNFILQNQRPEAINQISRIPDFLKNYLLENRSGFSRSNSDFQSTILSGLNTLLDTSATSLKYLSSRFFSFVSGFFGVVTNVIIVFTLAVFFSIEKNYLISLFVKASHQDQKEKTRKKLNNIYEKLSLRLKARILLSLFVILAMYLAFRILKLFGIVIPNIFSLALISGLLDIVPYVGPLFAFIPIVILALIHNGLRGMLIVVFVFLLVQWLQNNVITPFLMEKQLWINPILILVSALIGAVVMGFWGVVLSVPLAVIVGIFIDERD